MRSGNNILRLFPAFICLALCGAEPSVRGDIAGTVASLPVHLTSAAIAPKLGLVATVDSAVSEVVFYPQIATRHTAEGVKHLAVPGSPIFIMHKEAGDKSYFVVACKLPNSVQLIDDRTLQVSHSFNLRDAVTALAAPSSPAAPWVYYLTHGSGIGGMTLGRIDVAKQVDEGGEAPGREDCDDMAVSADGKHIYARRMRTSPKGFFAFEVESWPHVRKLAYLHEDSGPFTADPHGQFIGSGKTLWHDDLSRPAIDLAGRIVCIVPDKPLIFAINDAIEVYSYNTFKSLARLTLTRPEQDRGVPFDFRISDRKSTDRPLLYDSKDNAVVRCEDARAVVYSLAGITGLDEPMLTARVESNGEFPVGIASTLKVLKGDPQSQLTLQSAPKGLRLEKDALLWTPTDADLGSASVTVDISRGTVHRQQEFKLTVGRSSVQLPFFAMANVVSEDGHYALAREARGGAAMREGDSASTRIALVDLEKRTVIADATLPIDVRVLAVDSSFAYVGGLDAQAIDVLSLKDLSPIRKLFAQQPPVAIHSIAGVLYLGRGGLPARFKVPSLEALPPVPPNENMVEPEFGLTWPVPVDGGLLSRGVVYDAKMEKVVRAIQPEPIISTGLELTSTADRGVLRPIAGRWGLAWNENSVIRQTGPYLTQPRGTNAVVCPEVPAVASLMAPDMDRYRRSRVTGQQERDFNLLNKWCITIVDATSQTIQRTVPLVEEDKRGEDRYTMMNQQFDLFAAGSKFIARIKDRIFVVDAKQVVADFKPPVVASLADTALVIRNGRAATSMIRAQGGFAPYTYQLDSQSPGVSVDAATGKITVNPAAMKLKTEELIAYGIRTRTNQLNLPTIAARVDAYIKNASPIYQAITGQPMSDPAMAIPVQVSVHDRDQQTAVMRFDILTSVPKAAAIKILDTPAMPMAGQPIPRGYYPPANQGSPLTRPGYPATQMGGPQQPTAGQIMQLQRENFELRRRNQDLEAQNRLLRDMVMQRNGATTNPSIR